MWLKSYLIVTGIGAFIALAMPGVVVIASFLIIPGLILMIMPTAFMYGLVFALIRMVLSAALSGVALNLASAIMTLALFWVIPQPGLIRARALLATLKQPDVRAATPIALKGHVRITRRFESRCDALCAALLKTPGVTSVRIETTAGYSYTYRIVPSATPGKRAEVVGHGLIEEKRERRFIPGDPLAFRRALEAEWNLMLSNSRVLLQSEDVPRPDFTIAIEDGPVGGDEKGRSSLDWSLMPSTPQRKALTISDARGEILLRQSILSIRAVRAPLLIGVSGGIENFRFGWDRKRLGDGKEYAEVPINQLLIDHSTIARGVDVAAAEARTREELAKALEDPARPAGDPAFALANQWMGSFRPDKEALTEADRRLLLRILADPRVVSADGIWAIVKRIDGDPTEFRRAAAKRYLAASEKKDSRQWVNAFAGLPKGAYAEQLAEERDILASPDISRYATGLIKRQGDRGVAAVPDLLRLLREYSVYDPGKYGYSDLSEAINAVRDGFRIIGPSASLARPEIERLLTTPALERRYRVMSKEEWDILLVVLGKPIQSLSKPENRSGTDASYRDRVARKAAKPFDSP